VSQYFHGCRGRRQLTLSRRCPTTEGVSPVVHARLARVLAPLVILGAVALVLLAWKRPTAVAAIAGSTRAARLPAFMRATPMRFAAVAAAVVIPFSAAAASVGSGDSGPARVPQASATADPTDAPTQRPTPEVTEVRTPEPTERPTPVPTPIPTPVPTAVPTPVPTPVPTAVPTPVPTPVPTAPPPPCHTSYVGACLTPGVSDYDCAGGSGDGPYYVAGPIQVVGHDEYDLDRDGDGIACEAG
jgi:outer membrane biosynthesis protein TonB